MPVYQLVTRSDIEKLKNNIRFFDRPASFRVELLCPNALTPNRRRSLERRLAFCLSDCGCGLASLAIIMVPLVLYFYIELAFLPAWPNTTIYILSTLGIALTTKLLSLLASYRLAFRTIDEMLNHCPLPSL